MKSLTFSFSLLVYNKMKYFGLEPTVSKMGCICSVLAAERSNDIALVLKVGILLYKLYCFKPITIPKIVF